MSTDSRHDSGHSSAAAAIFLWVVVICGLLYGVVETATKIPALLGA